MRLTKTLSIVAVAALLSAPAGAAARQHHLALAGGTAREREQVSAALAASSFDWQLVPAQIAIHIARGVPSRATPGEIWLDANLLDAVMFAWGVVQHEYAHQVDFFLLDAADRAVLLRQLGGSVWCSDQAERRDQLGCERFASTLAWAYWPSRENCMRPQTARPFTRAQFRGLVSRLLRTPAERAGVEG
jgi:hypothetical protein